ncbi:hypothetical protein E3N88_20954 [Mikania micrantha]|uniref:Transmembrane protein n=1 Tax=Mikania micrantha TaxID=192012 RepID=A0A5N6NII1_9ASTR|nr:hypothetical protein E3N88_20954 [Mikania micrantha]
MENKMVVFFFFLFHLLPLLLSIAGAHRNPIPATFNVLSYGALPNRITDNTKARMGEKEKAGHSSLEGNPHLNRWSSKLKRGETEKRHRRSKVGERRRRDGDVEKEIVKDGNEETVSNHRS